MELEFEDIEKRLRKLRGILKKDFNVVLRFGEQENKILRVDIFESNNKKKRRKRN